MKIICKLNVYAPGRESWSETRQRVRRACGWRLRPPVAGAMVADGGRELLGAAGVDEGRTQ